LHLVGHFIRIQLLLSGDTTVIKQITEAVQERINKKAHLKQNYNIIILIEKLVKKRLFVPAYNDIKVPFNFVYRYVSYTAQSQLKTHECNNHTQPMQQSHTANAQFFVTNVGEKYKR
jgi:septum formation inhibitor MinC